MLCRHHAGGVSKMILLVLTGLSSLLASVQVVPAPAPPALQNCVFCAETQAGDGLLFNLSNVSSAVFTLHSGTRGSVTDPWLTYYATSPCGSVGSAPDDMCFSGSTADPVAQHYTGTTPSGRYGVAPICSGLGSLAQLPTVLYSPGSPNSAATLNITLLGGTTEWCANGTASVTYAMRCDPTVPRTNAPNRIVAVDGNCSFTVSWQHPSICVSAASTNGTVASSDSPTVAGCSAHRGPPAPAPAPCKGCLPPWKPTWNMSRSTILYTCNYTGMHDVSEAVRYGVAAYDWSNAKSLWANAHPMNAEELLTRQAEQVLAADPGIQGEQPRVWVYRNKIKALNWFSSVREKLDDERFAGWFVKFKDYKGRASNGSYHVPACDWYGNATHPPKCSGFYHDQGQTPNHPGANQSVYKVDGACATQCDCGPTNPCGEYTFDHRNASFSDWFVNRYMINEGTLLHKPIPINVGWLDDEISLLGMSEGAPYPTWMSDTGSTPEAMQEHVDAFRQNIARLQKAIVERGGFYWQMITGRGPLIRPAVTRKGTHNVTASQCAEILRQHYCMPAPDAWRSAHIYEIWPTDPNIGEQAVAEFLLTRGDYAWIGYSWSGCESSKKVFPRPLEWDVDYGGAPSAPCAETGHKTGIFVREYPKAIVQWNCNSGRGQVTMKV